MNLRFNVIYISAFICMFCALAFAQQNDGALSLEEVLSIAKQNNPKVLEAQQRMKIAEARYRQVKKLSNPELDVDVAKIAYDLESQNKFDDRTLEGEVRLTQPLQTWGKRGLSIGIAEDEKRQAELEFQNSWVDIARQVKEQYNEALLQQESIELARDSLDRSQRLLEQVNIEFNEGKARNHELARSKLEVSKARNDFLEAENNSNISIGKLNILLGRNMDEVIELKDNLNPEYLDQSFEKLLSDAYSQRADILIKGQEISKKEKELKLAKRKRLPDVNVGLFVEREEEIYSAGAGISFELPIWNQYHEDINEASINIEMAQMNLHALKKQVELDVYMAFKNVDLTRKAIGNLQESIKEANELLRIITIEYQEGEVPFLTYLEGLASYKETKQDYLETLANYAGKLAVLEQSIGGELELKEKK